MNATLERYVNLKIAKIRLGMSKQLLNRALIIINHNEPGFFTVFVAMEEFYQPLLEKLNRELADLEKIIDDK